MNKQQTQMWVSKAIFNLEKFEICFNRVKVGNGILAFFSTNTRHLKVKPSIGSESNQWIRHNLYLHNVYICICEFYKPKLQLKVANFFHAKKLKKFWG